MSALCRLCEGVELTDAMKHIETRLQGQPAWYVQERKMAARNTILSMLAEVRQHSTLVVFQWPVQCALCITGFA